MTGLFVRIEEDHALYTKTHDRFWQYIEKSQDQESCWLWTGCTNHAGYGWFSLYWNKPVLAHRLSYFFSYGIDPEKLFVCHRCDNPPCCNPNHLFLGSSMDNITDMIGKGRKRSCNRTGSNNTRAKLTEVDIPIIRKRFLLGHTNAEIARDYGVVSSSISKIRLGQRWSHIK